MDRAKKEMHIIDEAIRYKLMRHAWDWKGLLQELPKARRFVFSPESSLRLGQILNSATDLVLLNHQFAIPPYPVTYIEINSTQFHIGHADPGWKDEKNLDRGFGMLITDKGIFPCIRGYDGEKDEMISLMSFVNFGYDPRNSEITSTKDLWPEADMPYDDWGFARLTAMLSSRGVNALMDHGAEVYERIGSEILSTYSIHRTYTGVEPTWGAVAGDMLYFFVALLVMHHPQHLQLTPVRPERGIVKGKLVTYAAHHTVEIGTVKEYQRILRNLRNTHRESPRRHEVRGHFVHYPASARFHCTRPEGHAWPSKPEMHKDAPSWTCAVCGGIRTWRADFQRGDAAKGFVTKDYEHKESN